MSYFIFLLLCTQFVVTESSQSCSGSQGHRVHLTALLEVSESPLCDINQPVSDLALSLAIAAEYVIEKVNNNQSTLAVPGITYGLRVETICNNKSMAVWKTISSIREGMSTKQQSKCSSDVDNSLLLGFLGPIFSSNTREVARFLSHINIPIITPTATLAELSDKTKYRSLLRTIPSDDKQSKALVEIALKMEWTYILLVHTDDEYGIQGAEAVEKYAKLKGLCVSSKIEVAISAENSDEYYRNLTHHLLTDQANAIIYFGQSLAGESIIEFYLDQIKKRRAIPRKAILSSDGLQMTSYLLDLYSTSPNTEKLELLIVSSFQKSLIEEDLKEFVIARLSGKISGLADISELIQRLNCEKTQKCKATDSMAIQYTSHMAKAVTAYLHAFKVAHHDLCRSHQVMCNEMRNSHELYSAMLRSLLEDSATINFEESSEKLSFDKRGDILEPAVPAYQLTAVTQKNSKTWRYDEVGYFYYNNTWNFNDRLVQGGPIIVSRCTDQAYCHQKCHVERLPYVFQKRNSSYIIIFSHKLGNKLSGNDCGETVSKSGFLSMEAFYYAAERIHELTGVDFSTLFIETCNPHFRLRSIMSEIFKDEGRIILVDKKGIKHNMPVSNIAGYIGDGTAVASLWIQSYIKPHEIIQISHASTSDWLKQSPQYPFFMKNVPSDIHATKLIINIAAMNKWSTIGLIHSDSPYGEAGREGIIKYTQRNFWHTWD